MINKSSQAQRCIITKEKKAFQDTEEKYKKKKNSVII